MAADKTDKLLTTFFGKRFSKGVQLRFRYWFRSNENRVGQEDSMASLWENSPSVMTADTRKDWEQLQERITVSARQRRRTLFHRIGTYTAAVAILLLTVAVTRLLSVSKDIQVVTPELVEIFVPYGNRQAVHLSDGTTVWLNAGSLLIYPPEFTASTRSVYLSGEANFCVAKNPEQPFIVKTNSLTVRALGTTFNVQAYPNAPATSVILEEGSVQVHVKSADGFSCLLRPNEQLVYSHLDGAISVNPVDAEHLALWKKGYLVFEDARFEELISTLERKYNVMINYNAEKFKGQSYYVKFTPDETLEEALQILSQLINGFKYELHKQTVNIR